MSRFKVLNLGAGWQSTTLYLMAFRGDEPELVPRFDFAVFADTQEEPHEVYEHLDWLRSLGGPPILTGTAGKLGNDLMAGTVRTGQRFASIPAYTRGDGDAREGRVRRQCTREYKIDVIERVIRREVLGLAPGRRVPRGVVVDQYLGLSFDEPGRIIATRASFQSTAWAEPHFPLFELEMSRLGCGEYLRRVAPGRKIPRSACVCCPFRNNEEWRYLRDHDPEGWARAVELDNALRAEGSVANRQMSRPMYLHRSCVPLERAPIDSPESRGEQHLFGFAAECLGMCGV